SSRRRHTRFSRDWSSDVCSSDLLLHDDGALHASILGDLTDRCFQRLADDVDTRLDVAVVVGQLGNSLGGHQQRRATARNDAFLKIGRASCRERENIFVGSVAYMK